MAERVRIRVWCEDREHEMFARRLLMVLGVERRQIDCRISPAGQGSAAAWVVAQHPHIRTQARAKKNQANLGFLVIVDGDNEGVDARLALFARDEDERVAILVPTWSIETWVAWLAGNQVVESRSYKSEIGPKYSSLLDSAISAWSTPRATEDASVPSLTAARRELKRLPIK